jgi:hypothetical protein
LGFQPISGRWSDASLLVVVVAPLALRVARMLQHTAFLSDAALVAIFSLGSSSFYLSHFFILDGRFQGEDGRNSVRRCISDVQVLQEIQTVQEKIVPTYYFVSEIASSSVPTNSFDILFG